MGARAARRYFLTAERFGADEARRLGLVSEVVDADKLDESVGTLASHLLKGGPHALAAAKDLIAAVNDRPIESPVIEDTARRIASQRASAEHMRWAVTAEKLALSAIDTPLHAS